MNIGLASDRFAMFCNKKTMVMFAFFVVALLLAVLPEVSLAATGGEGSTAGKNSDDFEDVWTTLKEWTQGSLGRVIAGSMILVGIIGGIARQSIMAFAIGIAGGMGLTYAPDIIETVVSATLENAEAATVAAIQVSNGLGL